QRQQTKRKGQRKDQASAPWPAHAVCVHRNSSPEAPRLKEPLHRAKPFLGRSSSRSCFRKLAARVSQSRCGFVDGRRSWPFVGHVLQSAVPGSSFSPASSLRFGNPLPLSSRGRRTDREICLSGISLIVILRTGIIGPKNLSS